MKKLVCNTKYEFVPGYGDSHIDYSELVTVPDQVMSMYDIYMKYAVRGEIAGLANNIRPHVSDDLDMFDESVDFVPEDDLDILQRSREIRTRQQDSSHAASEHIPVGSEEPSDKEPQAPAKPEKPASPDAGSE